MAPLLAILLLQILLMIAVAAFVVFIFYALIVGFRNGAPFVRSRRAKRNTMLAIANIKQGDVVMDLGSGDGTLLLEVARLGGRTVGVEINPFLVFYSRMRNRLLGLARDITIQRGNLRDFGLGEADIVFLYLLTTTNASLREKFERELKPTARVITNDFPVTGWTPAEVRDGVYLYYPPKKKWDMGHEL